MLLQLLPVPLGTIENPVWRSTAAAIPGNASGHLSIDLGFTLRALFGYLGLISLTLITSVLTRNCDRAGTILFALCAITTFAAGELLLLGGFSVFNPGNRLNDLLASLVAPAAFGVILNAAFVVRTIKYRDTGSRWLASSRAYLGMMLFGTFGVTICLIDLVFLTTYDILLAVLSGLTMMGLVVLSRRLGLRRWTLATVGIAALVAWGGVVALRFTASPSVSPLLRFARVDSAEAGAPVMRMISDINWAGAGVGSYHALATIHRDSTGVPGDKPINAATKVLLEWGGLGTIVLLVPPLQLLIVLFRGALSRGRDSFYAAAAAACVVTAFLETYCDTSFSYVTVQILGAVILGLGLSQSTGRQAS